MYIIELLWTGQYSSFWFFEWILYIFFCFFFITFWVFSLNIYFNENWKSRKSLLLWVLSILLVFLLSFIPALTYHFYDIQIQRAGQILSNEWQNYKWYTDSKVFLLERAFYSKIKRWENIDVELFKKIFDSTPEEYFWEKIANYTDSRFSSATNSSKIGDKANVILDLAEIENRVVSESHFQVLETIYKFNFSNLSDENQEVIINFETPSKYSVVSGLRLWLDLQLLWQIAPRWAARQVYEDSLRRNIDPALIEKIGLNTYNLRVFPIPSRQDIKSQWKQIVAVTILTPILTNKENVTYSPKFSFINLKFNENSWIHSKIYNEWKLIKEDIVKNTEIEKYLTQEHTIGFDSKINSGLGEFCINEDLSNILKQSNISFVSWSINLDKTSIFFDNSKSAERDWVGKYYEEIYSKLKNFWWAINDVDLYSYNFYINKILSANDIKFWWYSDIDGVIDYIINNKISNQRIVLVTDDDNFNYSTIENKSRDYTSLLSNQISIIKIGKKIKSYKQDINNIMSATNWNIYEVSSSEDINSTISKIFDIKKLTNEQNECTSIENEDNFNKIQAAYISNILLANIKNDSDWQNIADLQTQIAQKYNIINQFNSFIALETQSQQEDLEQYKNENSKYDSTYSNNEWSFNNKNFSGMTPWGMMPMRSGTFSGRETSAMIGQNISSFGAIKWSLKSFSYSEQFNWRVSLSFLWLLMFFIYLVELYSFVAFIINYKKWGK